LQAIDKKAVIHINHELFYKARVKEFLWPLPHAKKSLLILSAMVEEFLWLLPHAKKSLLILSAMVEEFLWLLPHATIRLQAVGR